MCQALPGRVLSFVEGSDPLTAQVDFAGLNRAICMDCVPDAKVGDYVIVHAGFAISCMDEAEAQETLALFKQLGEPS
ncbi:MAG: HypC/HybG/HupF family hydrogenase formation chaperone [bacterium]|nr:HypC/HybG/HupF family hydrogenase formation chaperone [bacterium]